MEKNKIVFVGMLICVALFIGAYAAIIMGDDKSPVIEGNQIPVPKLADGYEDYQSKLDALNDLKEVKETTSPSMYDERLLDSMGIYDPDLLNKQKMRIVDSIYRNGQIKYSDRFENRESVGTKVFSNDQTNRTLEDSLTITNKMEVEKSIEVKDLALEHLLFFASDPAAEKTQNNTNTDDLIYVRVDGTQTVKSNFRLQMLLDREAIIDGIILKRNTPLYGFISFKPNRVTINIENINHQAIKLKSYDLQDGSEGIYIVNSFKGEATQEVIGDMVGDINMAGMPQLSGVRKIFQRNNRNVKVTISDNYKLILKGL